MTKPVALFVLVALSSCFMTAEKKDAPLVLASPGEVLWVPPVHEGFRLATITRRANGHIELYVDPALIYQDAMDCGRSYNNRYQICTRYVEMIPGLAPNGAATSKGWRNPMKRFEYPLSVKSIDGREGGYLDVKSDGVNYLFILTTITLAPQEIEFHQAKEGEGNAAEKGN